MFSVSVLMVCVQALILQCEAGGYLLGLDGGAQGLYQGYGGAYAGTYKNYKPYAFEYGVSDPYTGDQKSQWETKDEHGTVRGSYSLLEPDGSTRVVDYVADDHGFRAVVKKIGHHGISVETHGGAEVGHQAGLLSTPIVVAEPEPHIAPIAAAIPSPVVTAVAPVPTSIHHEPTTYNSYNGGYENYQNLVPYTVPKAVAHQEPVYVQPEVLTATKVQHVEPYNQEYESHQNIEAVPLSLQGSLLNQHVLSEEKTYHEPILVKSHHYQQPIYREQPIVTKEQLYQPVVEQNNVYYQPQHEAVYNTQPEINYHAQPIVEKVYHHSQPSVLNHDSHVPLSNYQLEQSFGGHQPHDEIRQPGHYISHPHGESSQSYHGTTGEYIEGY